MLFRIPDDGAVLSPVLVSCLLASAIAELYLIRLRNVIRQLYHDLFRKVRKRQAGQIPPFRLGIRIHRISIYVVPAECVAELHRRNAGSIVSLDEIADHHISRPVYTESHRIVFMDDITVRHIVFSPLVEHPAGTFGRLLGRIPPCESHFFRPVHIKLRRRDPDIPVPCPGIRHSPHFSRKLLAPGRTCTSAFIPAYKIDFHIAVQSGSLIHSSLGSHPHGIHLGPDTDSHVTCSLL